MSKIIKFSNKTTNKGKDCQAKGQVMKFNADNMVRSKISQDNPTPAIKIRKIKIFIHKSKLIVVNFKTKFLNKITNLKISTDKPV